MKKRLINLFVFVALLCFFTISLYSQTDPFKGVILDRDKNKNNCIVANNSNAYPCKIMFEYKLGDRNNPWTSSSYMEIPANCRGYQVYCPSVYEIKGLKITYVDILKPTLGEKLNEVFNNGNNSSSSTSQSSSETTLEKTDFPTSTQCETCKGKKGWYLFDVWEPCKRCNGTGIEPKH